MTPRIVRRATFAPLVLVSLLQATAALAQANAQAGDAFLKLIDGRAYGESWDEASEFLRRSISRDGWVARMQAMREPLGAAAVRILRDSDLRHDPSGAPAGDYLLLTYETTFTGGGIAKTETVPMILGADGRWRAVGYFVR